ncbi:hypothetical protein [Ruminococcus sp. Marseille-P6503]|uniref:hypothetical protein n=1 Tax=Ruminococcus sp. Marseille-P6503 TaxID=2364796 RepID=UPI000F53BD29|nr:hypothetical protein [Ruminococcus sp. Marseille-P6503]
MRDLKRNQSVVYYRNYAGSSEEITDEYGNVTGSYKKKYGELKAVMMSVSGSKGSAECQTFGVALDYDRTLATSDTSCDINESSILWLDGADTSEPHNYEVRGRSATINQIQLAVKRVDISD